MDKMIYTSLNSINNLIRNRINISQNLANIGVPGYRKDLEHQNQTSFLTEFGALSSRATVVSEDAGNFSNKVGSIKNSGVPTDVALLNESFMLAENAIGETVFTRRGDLSLTPDGILINGAGLKVLSEDLKPISLPKYNSIKISEIGEIRIDTPSTPPNTFTTVGVIASVDPKNYELVKGADGEVKNIGSGRVASDQSGRFLQGSLEGSNVNSVEEMVASIENQRQFEINMKLIKAAEEASRSGSSLLKISQ